MTLERTYFVVAVVLFAAYLVARAVPTDWERPRGRVRRNRTVTREEQRLLRRAARLPDDAKRRLRDALGALLEDEHRTPD